LSEDGLEVVRVDYGVASIPPFRIDVPSSSESIRFCAKMTRVEPDDKVKLGEVLRPPHLPLGQYLGSRKILKVLMICNNIDGIGQMLWNALDLTFYFSFIYFSFDFIFIFLFLLKTMKKARDKEVT